MTHTIDAGIGVFTANCEESLKLKMFLDSLKDQIEIGKLDEIISFLDGGCDDGLTALKDEIYDLKEELKDKKNYIDELKQDISDLEDEAESQEEINGGIATIGYKTDNLQTQMVMEELEEAIRKTNPLRVAEHLKNI